MLAKWFPAASLSRTNFFKHYKVPSCHGNERRVRALNIGFLVINYSIGVAIKNISRMWQWNYTLPKGTSPAVNYKGIWLTHWCVSEHRHIAPGDVLDIYVDGCRCIGVRVMYEDGKGDELEEEKFPFRGWPKISRETTSEEEKILQSVNQRRGEEKNDNSSAVAADVAAWYNHNFRSTDLSLYEFFRDSTFRSYHVNNHYANCT